MGLDNEPTAVLTDTSQCQDKAASASFAVVVGGGEMTDGGGNGRTSRLTADDLWLFSLEMAMAEFGPGFFVLLGHRLPALHDTAVKDVNQAGVLPEVGGEGVGIHAAGTLV